MRKNIVRLSVLFILALATVNCERASQESSRVSLQLPTYSKINSLVAMAPAKYLKRVIVNVSGDDFVTLKYMANIPMDTLGTELSSEIVLDVPSGPARKIQILAVYGLADGTKEIQYGAAVADIFGLLPAPITVALTNFGLFKGGSIVGRYLTGVNHGPTGKVIISMNHVSGMSMDILESEILNGWFEFFASENFQMSYRLADGTPLTGLQNKSLKDLTPVAVAGGAAPQNIARIYRPSSYYRQVGGSTWEPVNEFHDIIYGYFGEASFTANKYVCVDDTPVTMSNLATTADGTLPITYNYNAATGIHGVGGVGIGSALGTTINANGGGTNCTSSSTPSFSNNRITIRSSQFNGMGNDTAKAISSAFTYYYGATDTPASVKKYLKANGSISNNYTPTYTFYGLPGLFAVAPGITMFDGAKLYAKANIGLGRFDHVICTDQWLFNNGFTEYMFTGSQTPPILAVTDLGATIHFTAAPISTSGYILCPTKAGNLMVFGGIYADNLQ